MNKFINYSIDIELNTKDVYMYLLTLTDSQYNHKYIEFTKELANMINESHFAFYISLYNFFGEYKLK